MGEMRRVADRRDGEWQMGEMGRVADRRDGEWQMGEMGREEVKYAKINLTSIINMLI